MLGRGGGGGEFGEGGAGEKKGRGGGGAADRRVGCLARLIDLIRVQPVKLTCSAT